MYLYMMQAFPFPPAKPSPSATEESPSPSSSPSDEETDEETLPGDDGGTEQQSLLQKTGQLLATVVGNNLSTASTETEIERFRLAR